MSEQSDIYINTAPVIDAVFSHCAQSAAVGAVGRRSHVHRGFKARVETGTRTTSCPWLPRPAFACGLCCTHARGERSAGARQEQVLERPYIRTMPGFALVAWVVVALALDRGDASYCTGGPSPDAQPNLYPITTPDVVHVADYYSPQDGNLQRGGGRLFQAIHDVGNSTFPIVHLYGTGYQMGFAQGTLLKARATKMWDMFWKYLIENVPGGEKAAEKMLTRLETTSRPYIPAHFTEELQGLSDATGYNYTKLLWIHLFPESAAGHCSMFGAWGKATAKSYSGSLLQMRALDYIMADFLSDNHALIVYHPLEGQAYVNIGFIGTITLVTGVSAAKISLSQIGVSDPDDTFGPQRNGQGTPFNFLLRDILQYQTDLMGVKEALESATRTIDLILGFGSSLGSGSMDVPFVGVQYAADQVRFYDDTNMLPINNTWHPRIGNVVYHGMDWDCPAWTSLLGKQIREHGHREGNMTAEATIRYINPIVQTGNLHVAIYEVDRGILYLSHSAGSQHTGPKKPTQDHI